MVDGERKGYVTEEDFVGFFGQGKYHDEEKVPALPD